MIKLIFFAKYREAFGASTLELPQASPRSVGELIQKLQADYPDRCHFLSDQKLIISVNQELAKTTDGVKSGDVVAFFPPVTGG